MRLSAVDLNCDMGEGYGRWAIADADDARIMGLISSANIATGFHAGDPMLIDETVRLAAQRGVGVGAHPGYGTFRVSGVARFQEATRKSSMTSSIRSERCANLRVGME